MMKNGDKMTNIKLELPNLKYKDSFLSAVKEFHSLKQRNLSEQRYDKYPADMSNSEFQEKVVQPLLDESTGKGLPKEWSPATVFWIIETNDNKEETYVGRISLRHRLSGNLLKVGGNIGYDIVPSKRGDGYAKTALRLVLEEAKKIGIHQVLLTCDENNTASAKTIIGVFKEYGGKEEESFKVDKDSGITSDGSNELHFWVNTSKSLLKTKERDSGK